MDIDVYFSLGSNLGDRKDHIKRALGLLGESLGCGPAALSELIETEPWGYDSPNRFLNCCALFQADGDVWSPQLILLICKKIERIMGREHTESQAGVPRTYRDRPIDIDILFYGAETLDTPSLKIPHPMMARREFVMKPLRQIVKPEIMAAFPQIFD